MSESLFDLAFVVVAPFWVLMILAPGWRVTHRIASSPLTVVPVLVVYTLLAVPVFPELWALVTEPTLDGFRELAALADGAGAVWAQILAWDLLIGQWIYLESRRLGLHPLFTGPLLVLTVLLSPFALALFLVVRAVAGRVRGKAAGPAAADAVRAGG
jgi:hypothetical protein